MDGVAYLLMKVTKWVTCSLFVWKNLQGGPDLSGLCLTTFCWHGLISCDTLSCGTTFDLMLRTTAPCRLLSRAPNQHFFQQCRGLHHLRGLRSIRRYQRHNNSREVTTARLFFFPLLVESTKNAKFPDWDARPARATRCSAIWWTRSSAPSETTSTASTTSSSACPASSSAHSPRSENRFRFASVSRISKL